MTILCGVHRSQNKYDVVTIVFFPPVFFFITKIRAEEISVVSEHEFSIKELNASNEAETKAAEHHNSEDV